MSLLKNTRSILNADEFIRISNSGGIKYTPSSGETHVLYFATIPIQTPDKTVVEGLNGIAAKVHDINLIANSGSNYKAQVCLRGVIEYAEDGRAINDGTCPFCNGVAPSWDAFNYLVEQETKRCGLTGNDLEDHLKKYKQSISDERRINTAKDVLYVVVAKLYVTPDGMNFVIGADGLPEFDLKVMKLTENRLEKFKIAAQNVRVPFEGCEIRIQYGKQKNVRDLVGQSSISASMQQLMAVTVYPQLKDKIREAVQNFDWNGIENEFNEFMSMSTADADSMVKGLLDPWNRFLEEQKVNPNAIYLDAKYRKAAGVAIGQPQVANQFIGQGSQTTVAPPQGQMGAVKQAPQQAVQQQATVQQAPQQTVQQAVQQQAPQQAPQQAEVHVAKSSVFGDIDLPSEDIPF